MSESIVRVGVGVIVVRDDKVLLGLRAGSHGAGTWSCPGGHVEFGETIEECSIRETLEETGLNLNLRDNHFDWNEKFWPEEGKHYITIYSLGTIDNDAEPALLEPQKCLEWRWFTSEELENLTLMETTKMKLVIQRAIETESIRTHSRHPESLEGAFDAFEKIEPRR